MDDLTLMALRGSIAKWEKIVAGTGADNGPHDCPLCAVFIHHECRGCPVFKASGRPSCRRTPYAEEWLVAVGRRLGKSLNMFSETSPQRQRAREAAMSELAFLRSLLPVEHAAPEPEAGSESTPPLEQKLQASLPPDAGKIALMIMHKNTLLVTTASGNAYAWDEATKTMSHIQPIADHA